MENPQITGFHQSPKSVEVNGKDHLKLHGLDSADGGKMNKVKKQRSELFACHHSENNSEIGYNHFENWRTECCWYAQLQLPPPHK